MKKSRLRERRLDLFFPPYLNYRVSVIITNDKKKTHEKIVRKYNLSVKYDGYEAVHLWVETPKESVSYLIFGPRVQPGTIAHEAWHCVRRICDWTGMALDNENVGYHVGYITQEVFDFLRS